MAEYKLSYTASEIDEKLGKIDNLVASVNGVAPDENGNVEITIPDSGENVDLSSVVKLPTNEDGTPDHGTAGYYAVSDGNGGVEWVSSLGSDEEDIQELNIEFSEGYYWHCNQYSIGQTLDETNLTQNENSIYAPELIDLGADAVGNKLEIIVSNTNTGSTRCIGFCSAQRLIVSFHQEKNIFIKDEANNSYVAELPIDGRYLYISLSNKATTVSVRIIKTVTPSDGTDTTVNGAYVSVDGSDENGSGSADAPFATVSKALNEGFFDIVVNGGVYKERITINSGDRKHDGKRVSISPADPDKRVIFVDPDATIATTETLVDGYTKVYFTTTDKTFADNNVWIFQDGVPDATTLITDEERHPLERGMPYRCEDTKIERCTATTLTEALAEIEAADTYKWYIESGTIYFSRPQYITEANPLCGSFSKTLFNGFRNRARSLELVGIESKYLVFNVTGLSRATLKDCKSTNVYGSGAFSYDQSASIEFVRCEAARCFVGTLGDGFNGHSKNTGDPFSKQTTALFIDCWSHDNNDDGYSDHERSETTIIGGLYEYNGKAGVTPAAGSHCTCYNVISRNNYCGFYYTNSVADEEGGVGGQMSCINCVAENNNRGGSKSGYRVGGAENLVYLIGCKSIGHDYGYRCSQGKMRLVDCGSLNDITVKSGDNIVIQNTTIVV